MSEELTYRYKRLNELDEIFELTHSYGDDYPEIINRALDKIVNNEIELNKLKDRINKAIEFMKEYNEVIVPETNIKSLILKEEYKKIIDLLKGDKE